MSQIDQLYRLKSQLLTSGLQQRDNNLYQVINQLIGILSTPVTAVEEIINVDQPLPKFGVANLIVSDLQIQNLNSIPLNFPINVDNPAANVIIPISWFNRFSGSGNAFSADVQFRVQWETISFDIFTLISFGINTGLVGDYYQEYPKNLINLVPPSDPRGKNLQLSSTVDITGGVGNVFYSTLFYYVTAWNI